MLKTTASAATIQPLSHYDMSADRGFLSRFDPSDVALPGAWADAARVAMQLPDLLPSGRVRELLENRLPAPGELISADDLSREQAKIATVHYTFMVQAYVWGESQPGDRLPACLAVPMVALADRLDQQPLLTYSSYVLDNWTRLEENRPIGLDNLKMIQNFLAGQDEAWFVLVHVAIEACAGGVFDAFGDIISAAANEDEETAQARLEHTAEIWAKINALFDRMPERCDPYIYFERVRPYIHGWKDNPALPNGVIYEGVERYGSKAQAFRGQTGSQSSIVPSMDALLGVGHAADPLRSFLDQLHEYRPTGHRQFIDDVRSSSRLREFAKRVNSRGLGDAYNANIQAVADFRSRHLEYAASYINKQGLKHAGNDTDVGTGGTPFMRYLKKHRDETRANLI
jgi:indoleamine 2,3-dioxygenase